MAKKEDVIEALRQILQNKAVGTQEALKKELLSQGFDVNQSKLSRLLRKLGAIKVLNQQGEKVYHVPTVEAAVPKDSALAHLVLEICHNETTLLIKTHPGSAALIGHVLDKEPHLEILGTIAGDDVLMIIPKSIHEIPSLLKEIKALLS